MCTLLWFIYFREPAYNIKKDNHEAESNKNKKRL